MKANKSLNWPVESKEESYTSCTSILMTDIAILELGKHDVAIYRAASDLQCHITSLANGFQEQIAGETSDLQGQKW